jgi:hypothetical protein
VTINVTEVVGYTPPVRPTFGTEIGRTFRDSISNLGVFLKAIVLISVAVAPWTPILFVILLPFVWLRWRRRSHRVPPIS